MTGPVPSHPARLPALAGVGLDDLLGELRERADAVAQHADRLNGLLDAVVAVSADLDLPAVLDRIVGTARRLVGARYAALGVLDASGGALEQFVTAGMTEQQRHAIGPLPSGRGVLGHVIHHPEPLRTPDLGGHPSSAGFPANHPPMASFLGVPVRVRERVFGNLYLTDKEDGTPFTDADEAVVVALAAAASIAVVNARSYARSGRRQRWLEVAAEATEELLRPAAGQADAWNRAVTAVLEIESAAGVALLVDDGAGPVELAAVGASAAGVDPGPGLSGSAMAALLAAAHDVGELPAELLGLLPWPVTRAVAVALHWVPGPQAVLVVGWERAAAVEEFPEPVVARRFLEQLVLAREVAAGQAARERLAVLEDRDRIARDLHDHVIQRLFAVGLTLQSVDRAGLGAAGARLDGAVDEVDGAIRDLRRAVFQLQDRAGGGLRSQLETVIATAADALGLTPDVTVSGPVETVPGPVARHLVAVLREALSNVTKHAAARSVTVRLEVSDGVRLEVSDDGRGVDLPPGAHRGGLTTMSERAAELGGTFETGPARGGGTTLTWWVPL